MSEATRGLARAWLARHPDARVVEMVDVRGSAPRAAGTRMLVSTESVAGTIGGGHLELEAIRLARESIRARRPAWTRDWALGPSLGQCCGGAVTLRVAPLDAAEVERWPAPASRFHVAVFGAGHVGRAIVSLLETLPCTVDLIDGREEEFAAFRTERAGRPPADHVRTHCVDAVEAEVAALPPGALVLILTHSHDLDLSLCDAALRRADLPFVGLIGSATKRARFERRLRGRGHDDAALARWVSPIGLPGIDGKEPAVIAVAVAAQLLRDA